MEGNSGGISKDQIRRAEQCPEGVFPALNPGCSALHYGLPQLAMAWRPATTPLSCGVEDDELIHAITRPIIALSALARMLHQQSAAARGRATSTSLRSVAVLDVLPSTPAGGSLRAPCICDPLIAPRSDRSATSGLEDGVPGNRRAHRIPSWGIGPIARPRKPEGCYS